MIAISAENLGRNFGDIVAVDTVDLNVSQGEIYGFLGPNGAGKSTVVRMLTTLLTPSNGKATVMGLDVETQANNVRLRIGVALQEASLDKKQSGREILTMQGRLYGLSKKQVTQRIEEVSSIIDVESIDRKVGTYSGGMERRLDLAASIMHNPDVLFLDEPTTGLDPVSRVSVWDEVRKLNRDFGTTIFLTTQYLEEADELADRVGIINNGLIVGEGTPTELKRAIGSDVIQVRLEDNFELAKNKLMNLEVVENIDIGPNGLLISVLNGAASVSDIAVNLSQNNIDVKELTLRTPTLDDVFLELTGARMEVG